MFHPLLQAVFAALETAGVRWCLLRPPTDPAAPASDVDLLLHPADVAAAREVLGGLDFARYPGVGSGREWLFLAYHPATDRWLRLHLVSAVAFGSGYALRTDAGPECLARRRHDGAAAHLADDDAFWMTMLHSLLDKGALAERHRQRLAELAGAGRRLGPLRAVAQAACPAGWDADRLEVCVRQQHWEELERLSPALRAQWFRRQGVGARLRRWGGALLRLPARAYQRWRRRGLNLAVLGPDGAGKSTVAAGVTRSFFGPVRTLYMGFGVSGGRPPSLARLGAGGRLLVLWLQYLKARYHQARGRLVIFDRYTYDAFAPPGGRRPWWRQLASWVKAHACPAPDLVVILDAPGRLMFERKGDLNPDMLETQRQHFLELGRRLPRAEVVDATRPEAAVRVDVTDRLWKRYRCRWGR
jgi:thymidylate kinase